MLAHAFDSYSTLIICLTAHHLVDVLLAIALSFLTYFCIYGRTTEHAFAAWLWLLLGLIMLSCLQAVGRILYSMTCSDWTRIEEKCDSKHHIVLLYSRTSSYIHTDTLTQWSPGRHACKPVRFLLQQCWLLTHSFIQLPTYLHSNRHTMYLLWLEKLNNKPV